MNKSFLFPEQISEILIKNVKNLNAVFIFPTDTVLNSWSDFLIAHSEKTGAEAICMESFLAWDKFKSKYLRAVKEGFETIPTILKKFFAHNLILENSQKPFEERFQVIINPKDEYASHAFSFANWLQKNLSSLDLLQKRYEQNPDYEKDKEDLDYLKLYDEYKNFLEKNNLYEPSWIENSKFDANGKTFFLFYPELLEDFSEFSEILEESPDFNVFFLPKETQNPPAIFYPDSRTELRRVILKIIRIVNEGKADWSEIALSVPNIETYRPYLEREFSVYDVPFVIKAGASLVKNSAAKIFKEIFECYNSNYGYEKVRSLILDECVPWKDKHKKNREALVRIGNKMRAICSVDEKNIWFVAFNQKARELENRLERKKNDGDFQNPDFEDLKNELAEILDAKQFFGKLKHFTDAFFVENANFSTLLTCWQAFKSFFLKDDKNFSNEANNILGRAICELKEIVQIEQKYAACNLKVKNPFEFFITELESKKYAPQQKNKTGICVFPYNLSALCYFKYQFVIDASQKNLEIPYKKLNFLNASKRAKLRLTDDDKLFCASEVFIKLYAKKNPTNETKTDLQNHIVFSASENSFSGFSIPHSSLKIVEKSENDEENSALDKTDYISNEKKILLNQNFLNDDGKIAELTLTQNQKKRFLEWAERNFCDDCENDEYPPYKINQKMREKINKTLKENRIGVDILNNSQTKTQNVKITARADLENFFPCPRKWIFKSILKLRDDTLDTELMRPYDMGNLNHKILELFMSSFENKILPFFDEISQSFKITPKIEGESNSAPLDYDLNLTPFVEKAIVTTQNIKDAPLVVQSLKAQKEKIEKNVADFLKTLLLPFGEKQNCKKGYEKLNGIGNCAVFACEKSFTAVENIRNDDSVENETELQYFGKIDALLISPENDWIVIDYKNSTLPTEINVDADGILKDFQMPVYFKILHEEKMRKIAAGVFYSIKEGKTKSAADIFAKKKIGDGKNATYEQCKTFGDFKETMNALTVYATTFEKTTNLSKNRNENNPDFSPRSSNSKNDILNVNVYEDCQKCHFKNICRTTYVIGKKSLKEKKIEEN